MSCNGVEALRTADFVRSYIDQTGRLLRQKILAYAAEMLGCSAEELDIVEGNVVRKDSGAVEMTGNVLLTQGNTAVSGEKLVIDLKSGKGTMQGRVKTVFQPGGN